jgi:hypothetical protein
MMRTWDDWIRHIHENSNTALSEMIVPRSHLGSLGIFSSWKTREVVTVILDDATIVGPCAFAAGNYCHVASEAPMAKVLRSRYV